MSPARAGLALAALACAAPLWAAEWARVTVKDAHEHYYDRGKLTIEGDLITYWRRVVFRPPQLAKGGLAATAMYRERIDCALHSHRTLGYLLYAQNGGVLENVYTPEAAPQPIIPETVGDRFESVMCALVARERARNPARRAPEPTQAQAKDAEQIDSEPMNQAQILAEIARLEARLDQLRAQLATMSAPAPAVREAPPLSLPEPVVLQDEVRGPVLPAGTPTP